jgi:hypothetical protein
MRPAPTLLGTALALALAWPAHGENPPVPATVLTDGAEVRCKPGTEPAVYVTQKLPRGSTVQVVERLPNGWLKIEPPPKSYSWVNTRSLRLIDNDRGVWVVSASDGQGSTLVGSWARTERPNVVGTSLARGAQVIAVGGTLRQEDGDWLPILPPPGEYRYVLARDISPLPGVTSPPSTTVAHPGAPPPATGAGELPALPGAAGSPPGLAGDVHVPAGSPASDPLLEQAQQLERQGDRLGAARLYDQLGNKYAASNHEAAVQYYSKAGWLRGPGAPVASAPVTEADAAYQRARQAEQDGNWPEAVRNYNRLGDLFRDNDYKLSLQYYNRAGWLKQKHPATDASPAPPAATGTPAPQSSVVQARAISLQEVGPGRVVASPTPIDGRPTYVLESAQGTTMAYLTPQPGVDLERYVGQSVRLVLGNSVQRSDLRVPYMKVTRVDPFPPQ